LGARSGHGFRSRRWPVGSFCFEHGIDLCLHGGEVVPTWAAVTRRNRGRAQLLRTLLSIAFS
jgi:hypothetical protein